MEQTYDDGEHVCKMDCARALTAPCVACRAETQSKFTEPVEVSVPTYPQLQYELLKKSFLSDLRHRAYNILVEPDELLLRCGLLETCAPQLTSLVQGHNAA